MKNKGTNKQQQQPDSSIQVISAHCPRVNQVSMKKNEEIKG